MATGVEDGFRNAGQVCGGLTRILVPRDRLREAEDIAVAKAESYVLGDPFDSATTLGPVATAAAHARVRSYIRVGVMEGARLLTGGAEQPPALGRGYFVRPTVFTGDNSMRIAQEEIFGPVLVIIPYSDEDKAIAIANDSPLRTGRGHLVRRPSARPQSRRAAAGRADPDQRRAARQARHPRRVQALGRGPRMGPDRHRGVPRVQVGHRITRSSPLTQPAGPIEAGRPSPLVICAVNCSRHGCGPPAFARTMPAWRQRRSRRAAARANPRTSRAP